jgi:beta-lactam-binding protein with PASTA domain
MDSLISLLKDKRLYLAILGVIAAGIVLLFLMDRVIMPAYTNYNQGITVPDITKKSVEEAQTLLAGSGLRYEIIDRRSNENFPPDFVLDQAPKGNSIVKPNRKIYLTVNATETPTVVVPELTDLSLRNAEIQLASHGLERGYVEYASSRFQNTVLGQSIPAGSTVRRGTPVNLVVSDGLGMNRVKIPEIVGERLAVAQREIRRAGLRVGEIVFQPTSAHEPNIVLSFTPANTDSLFEGERINLRVSELSDIQETEERGAVITDSTDVEQKPEPDPDNRDE